MKSLFLKRLLAVVRGVIKGLPIGGVAKEIAENLKQSEVVLNEEGVPVVKSPHDWISICTQLTVIALIVYSFFTKELSLENVMRLLGVQF